jgi:NADH:ubiquinone oxidoreductase subunit E
MVEQDSLAAEIRALIDDMRQHEGNLILILHAIQDKHGYVPRQAALLLSEGLGIELARIYEVLTFYHYFSTSPPGKHSIVVCNGTACYLDGGEKILSRFKDAARSAQADGSCSVKTVRCLGCCSMGPLALINGRIKGRLKSEELTQESVWRLLNDA